MHFNILDEPWIPVLDQGVNREVGLLELFSRAHEIETISDQMPLSEPALYQLLHLMLSDCFAPEHYDEVMELLEMKSFAPTGILQYLEDNRPYFDLFDPHRPFLQNPQTPKGKTYVKGANFLLHGLASGSNVMIHTDSLDDDCSVSPAILTRAMLVCMSFSNAPCGGYTCSPTGEMGWVHVVRGKNLFETLLLNLYAFEGHKDRETVGEPLWRRTLPKPSRHKEMRTTYRECMLYPLRSLLLIPREAQPGEVCHYTGKQSPILVSQLNHYFGVCFGSDEKKYAKDLLRYRSSLVVSNLARENRYKGSGELTMTRSIKMSLASDLFRDLQPLLYNRSYSVQKATVNCKRDKNGNVASDYIVYTRAPILTQLSEILSESDGDHEVELDLYGFCADKSKCVHYVCHRLRGSSVLFRDPETKDPAFLRETITRYIQSASSAISSLRINLMNADANTDRLTPTKRTPGNNGHIVRLSRSVGGYLMNLMWQEKIPAMSHGIPAEQFEDFTQRWAQQTANYLLSRFDQECQHLPTSGKNLLRIAEHRLYLQRDLIKYLGIKRKDEPNEQRPHQSGSVPAVPAAAES